MPVVPKPGSPPGDACPARVAPRPRLTIEPRGRSKRVGRRVDPGPWGGRALTGPPERRGSHPEEGGGRGGRQSPRPEPAYLGSSGLGTDHAPIRAQVRDGGRTCPAWCAGRRGPAGGVTAAPTRSRNAPGAGGERRPRPRRTGACDLMSVCARRGPAGSETHCIPAPTTAPHAR